MTRAKRVLGALMLMVLCTSSWLMAARAGPIVSVVSPGSETLGNSFTVNITVTGAVDLYAFQFDLDFDPTILQATSVAEGAFLPSGGTTIFVPGTIDNTGGVISSVADTLVGPIAGVNGNGDLAVISFDAIGTGMSALTLANEIFLDSTLTDITDSVAFSGGTVTVSASSIVPEPSTLALMAFGVVSLVMIRRRKA